VADNTLKAIKQSLELDGLLDKCFLGSTIAFANQSQTQEVVDALNNGLLDTHDFIGCNYYGHGTVATPMTNANNFDTLTFYNANVTAAKKKPIILTECGLGKYYIDKANANTIVNTETEQATSRTNMLNALVTNPVYSVICQGALIFCLNLQENRNEEYDVAYDSFTPVARVGSSLNLTTPNSIWSEMSMGDIELPIKGTNNQHGSLDLTQANLITNQAFTATKTFLTTQNYINI
jgi:hypothetical protein